MEKVFYELVKEEPVDHHEEFIENDIIIASYSIIRLENTRLKTFILSGLSNILDQNKSSCDISIRTDLKELKISSKINDKQAVFCTKESQHSLKKKTFAMKLSRETGNAYFIPINSMHSLTYLDELNRSSKPIDSQNLIFEDCCKMPYPARNKHDQLRIEMKNHLYKPLNRVIQPEMVRKLMDQLFTSTAKRFFYNSTEMIPIENVSDNNKHDTHGVVDLVNCPYWFLKKINLCDINRIEMVDLKMEVFLRKVQVIRFEEILLLFEIEIPKLLSLLQNICYLIRGNWVIKSHLLYKFNVIHDNENKQTQLKKMIAAREFLLWLFVIEKPIKVVDIIEKFKKINDYEEILNRLTIRKGSNSNIDFILGEDVNFISKYAVVAKKHHEKTKEILTNKHQDYLIILSTC